MRRVLVVVFVAAVVGTLALRALGAAGVLSPAAETLDGALWGGLIGWYGVGAAIKVRRERRS